MKARHEQTADNNNNKSHDVSSYQSVVSPLKSTCTEEAMEQVAVKQVITSNEMPPRQEQEQPSAPNGPSGVHVSRRIHHQEPNSSDQPNCTNEPVAQTPTNQLLDTHKPSITMNRPHLHNQHINLNHIKTRCRRRPQTSTPNQTNYQAGAARCHYGTSAPASHLCCWPHRSLVVPVTSAILLTGLTVLILTACGANSVQPNESNLRFDQQTGAYQGLTFTFDPRLDKQVEQRLHHEHWLSIMQQSSSLLYESLNGRAHLAEIKVLIPFKWRQLSAELRPVLYKPGSPVITNRRLRFADSDVIVGFEDPVYKETPFSLQHDECGRPGLNIRMPISFLDQQQPQQQQSATKPGGPNHQYLDSRLKARQFVREFASHRFGIFKESGFRSDYMYPPFSSVAGLSPLDHQDAMTTTSGGPHGRWGQLVNGTSSPSAMELVEQLTNGNGGSPVNRSEQQQQEDSSGGGNTLRGFDEHFQECKFETSPSSGLPANAQAANCLPYLVRADKSLSSFNLMSSDPFVYAPIDRTTAGGGGGGSTGSQPTELPVQWDDLAEQTRWHFCGENFPNPNYASSSSSSSSSGGSTTNQLDQTQASSSSSSTTANNNNKLVHYEHNQRATNKQNKMCQERSTLEVIRMSEDFRNHQQFSPSNFNRLPTPNFKFLQEMPPRLIMCIEYTSHLFQSRRLDHPILESAINKFLALDLIAESELATVVFGQHQSRLLDSSNFQKLDSSLNSRFTLFNPAIDPFDEQVQYYSQSELAQMDVQSAAALMMSSSSGAAAASAQNGAATGAGPSSVNSQQQQPVKILKGSCSFAKMMAEVNVLLQKSSMQYDDIGADLIVLTSGLFIEDEPKIEEILRSSNFKLENNRLNMIIYPSSMLFDTKSREGIVVLDSNESEQIIRSRVSKLLLIQRLTGGKLHLIKEQLDSSGDVKMSTLVQFYQIFDQLAKGHSWDQTSSMVMLQSQQVDSRQQQQGTSNSLSGSQQQHQFKPAQYKLTFQFNLDESIQNELIVGFIDPKVQHQAQANLLDHRHHSLNSASLPPAAHKAGKRFSLKNLQLRSPGGQFVFTETNTTWTTSFPPSQGLFNSNNNQTFSDEFSLTTTGDNGQEPQESAFFPFRAQLSLAAFHVKPVHLSQLQAIKKLAGTWTLSALSDEPIQTSGVALARVNPQGDTLTGNCWIQTYNQESIFDQSSSADEQQQLKMVKVFVQTSGGSRQQRQEVETRMEVQDEMGNIVQNVQMLDDGLGAPDMTQNDGIHTQYVQRAIRPGFYKVSVELVTGSNSGRSNKLPVLTGHSGQDNVCCGSFVPNPSEPAVMSHHSSSRATRSSRQLYCGTFFVDSKSRLGHQRPPRLSNLTVVNVDQENRRVTLRWFEPQLDITSSLRVPLVPGSGNQQLVPILSETDLIGEETSESRSASSSALRASRSTRLTPPTGSSGPRRRQVSDRDEPDEDNSSNNYDDEHHRSQSSLSTLIGSNVLMASHQQHPHHQQQARSVVPLADQIDRSQSLLQNRYDIKVFFDRDMMKRAFDSKLDVGYKFNEWSVEGQFPNASQFGGMKEVTLRVPFSREGFYFIAMKVVNNIGLASQMSNIVQFYLRNNMTLEEVESIYGQPGMTVDADGNVYDKNGDLVQRGGGPGNPSSSYSLLKGTTALDGISVLILISVLAFMMVILCITLVACLASSARHSLKTNAANKTSRPHHHHHHDEGGNAKKKTIGSIVGLATGGGGSTGPISAGSGSSMVSSSGGCESSEMGACSGSSSLAGSCTGGGVGLHQNQDQQQQQLAHLGGSGSLFFDDLQPSQLTTYNKLQQQQRNQQQQAQMIHQQLISNKTTTLLKGQQQQQDFYSQPQQQQSYYGGPNHTIVNGYTYATVMQAASQQPHQDQQYQHYASGDLNQNGLVQHQVMDGTAIPTTSSAVINPVQSWPADILLSHYDKVKQARERNEAPPVMRIETLDNGLQYSDGLPTVFGEQQQQQQADLQQGQTKGLQYSTLREQQQAASYYNQQLHQQLSSVLKNKRQNMDYDGDGFRGTSPALEEISSDLLNTADGSSEQQQPTSMPPPPHYMYCPAPTGLPVDTNGLGGGGGGQLTDPSIYSQTTNLQQVMAGSPVSTQDQLASYYSNQQQQQQQWPASTTHQNPSYGMGQQHQAASLVSSSGIYSTSNLDQQQQLQQQQQQSSDAAISEV